MIYRHLFRRFTASGCLRQSFGGAASWHALSMERKRFRRWASSFKGSLARPTHGQPCARRHAVLKALQLVLRWSWGQTSPARSNLPGTVRIKPQRHLDGFQSSRKDLWKSSLSSVPEQDNRNGPKQDPQIKPNRPVIDVIQIELDPGFEISNFIAAAHLPETGKPRLNA